MIDFGFLFLFFAAKSHKRREKEDIFIFVPFVTFCG